VRELYYNHISLPFDIFYQTIDRNQ